MEHFGHVINLRLGKVTSEGACNSYCACYGHMVPPKDKNSLCLHEREKYEENWMQIKESKHK